jgi:hypothetical protein
VRRKKSQLALACGSPGHLKTSKLGTRFFAHNPGSGACDSHGRETPEHLLAKTIIVEAALAAGWSAEPEVPGGGWIADVLADNGTAKIAFEVQWSRQTADDYRKRQDRYNASGVRGAWFVRHAASVPSANKDLPVFLIAADSVAMTATVAGRVMPLAEAVAMLLTGKVKFREYVSNGQPSKVAINYHEASCHKCARPYLIWDVQGQEITGPCGYTEQTYKESALWDSDRPEAASEVRKVGAAVATRTGLSLANLQRRRTQMSGTTYMAFCCPHCNYTFGDWFVRQFLMECAYEAPAATVTVDGPDRGLPHRHWCVDQGEGQCVMPPPGWRPSVAVEPDDDQEDDDADAVVAITRVGYGSGGITPQAAVARMFGRY